MKKEDICNFIVERLKEQIEGNYVLKREKRYKKYKEEYQEFKETTFKYEENKGINLIPVCEELIDICIFERDCHSNISIIIILFNQKGSK